MSTQVFTGMVSPLQTKSIVRSKRVLIYTTTISAVGALALGLAFLNAPADWHGLALFALTAAIVELTSTTLFENSRSRVSVSSIVALASIFAFGPWAGALTHTASGMMTALTTSHQRVGSLKKRAAWWQRTTFNISMLAIAAASAGWVYVFIGGVPGVILRWENIPAVLVAVTMDWLVNGLLLIGVITLQTGQSRREIWNRDIKWQAPISIAGGIFGGVVLALAYSMFGLLGLAIVLLPILSTGYSFRLYKNNMKQYVDQLEGVNRALDDANLNLLETLGAVVDAYDIYTYGHSVQVSIYAQALAEKMRLPRDQEDLVFKAALVHDIGKVGVLDSIIGKQSKLTHEEYNEVMRHPLIGAGIVERMKGLQQLVPLVRSHHEHWDGKGYPDGLAGDEIPIGAQIISVADTIDAMNSDRPYRPTRSFKEVKDEIVRLAGTQFSPAVVAAFVQLVAEKGPSFFKNSATTVDRAILMGTGEHISTNARYLKKSMLAKD